MPTLLESSLSINTVLTYDNALSNFNNFRIQYHLPAVWPAPIHHIALFISFCFEKGLSSATIRTYVSGVAYHHKLRNWFDPKEIFLIKKLLEGCSTLRKSKDLRAPILFNHLKIICNCLSTVCLNSYETLLFKAAYTLAYFGLFRVSELVFTSDLQANRPLMINDVSFLKGNSVLKVIIRSSKTSRNGDPITLLLPCERETELCPVCCLYQFCGIRPKSDGFLFIHVDGKPLKRTQFTSILAKAVQMGKLSDRHFRSHSFRIGRATQLASDGVSMDVIQRLGRWKSDVCQLYIRH